MRASICYKMKVQMYGRLLVHLALLFASVNPLSAEPSIQRYFNGLSGYRFTLLNEVSAAEAAGQSSFPASVLKEAELQSLSTWQVDSETGLELEMSVFETGIGPGAFLLFTRHEAFHSNSFSALSGLTVPNRFNGRWGIFTVANYMITLRGIQPLSETLFTSFSETVMKTLGVEAMLPASIAYLPRTDLVRNSVQLHLSEESLSSNPGFPSRLIPEVRFQDQLEVAYAAYGPDASPLFVIAYPTPTLASEYAVAFQEILQGIYSADGIYMKRSGPLVSLFLGSAPLAESVLGEFKYDPAVEWIYEKREARDPRRIRTFLGLITRTLIGIGTFLLIVIACGTVVGLLRYEILQRFPVLTTRKQTIRLNLDSY